MVKKVVPIQDIIEDAEAQGVNPEDLLANPHDVVAAVDAESFDDDEIDDAETDD